MSLTNLQSVTGAFCTSPNSMNPGVRLQGQVVVQTATPPAITMRRARPRRIFLAGVVFRVTCASAMSNVALSEESANGPEHSTRGDGQARVENPLASSRRV